MKSHQRSPGNEQSDKGGTTSDGSSPRAGRTADKGNLSQPQQTGTLHGDSRQQAGAPGSRQSSDRSGPPTEASQPRQGGPDDRGASAVGGGEPISPAGSRQSADQKMDDDTGLSNTANREPSGLDQNMRQERQSNVGRRSDGTPD